MRCLRSSGHPASVGFMIWLGWARKRVVVFQFCSCICFAPHPLVHAVLHVFETSTAALELGNHAGYVRESTN